MFTFYPLVRKVKNVSGSQKAWRGVVLEDQEYYTLAGVAESIHWAGDPVVNAAINAGELITNDGTRDFTDPVAVKNMLRLVRRITSQIVITNATIQLTSYSTLGNYIWIENRNNTYRNGIILYSITVGLVPAKIRIMDATNNIVLAESGTITSSGIYELEFTNPTSDCLIEVQSKLTGLLGILTPPTLKSLSIEWDT